MSDLSKSALRKRLRAIRRKLSKQQQQLAAIGLNKTLTNSRLLNRHHHIAFYLANDGEIDPHLILRGALKQGRTCYLPVLAPNDSLWFVPYRAGDKLKKNRYGIAEPAIVRTRRKPWALGLVLLPLVGFDRQGGRLGMGGGFYDRSFSYIVQHPKMSKPQLVGLAHQCQEVDCLKTESWDIPLSNIATDSELISVS